MLQEILGTYGLTNNISAIEPFGTGLINHTWTVHDGNNKFILQRINEKIFKHPHYIAGNIRSLGEYLSAKEPAYLFVSAERTLTEEDTVFFAR